MMLAVFEKTYENHHLDFVCVFNMCVCVLNKTKTIKSRTKKICFNNNVN